MAPEDENIKENSKKKWLALRNFIYTYVPITDWLPKYKWKEYFVGDLMAGLTMAFLHVAQGMAFSVLAEVEPIMGLYTSCFPVFFYCIFGTAVFSSFGTVSVTSLLVGEAVISIDLNGFTEAEIVEIMTFLVGALYLVCFCIKYHVITKIFTPAMSSAFVMACAAQIIVKSLKLILGIKFEDFRGFFTFAYNCYYVCAGLPQTNLITLGISLCMLTLLSINTYLIIPNMRKVTRFIFPMELLLMVTVTLVSHYVGLEHYNVVLLGYVPTGFSSATLPPFEATLIVWPKALIIGFVNLATTIAMVIMFNPDVRIRQEMLALGIANSVCSSFHTIPFGNSIMRTALAQSSGAKTLLAQIISATIVLLAILFMGPALSPLPMCALGCIVIYGLSMMFITKSKELPKIFRSGTENIIIWVCTAAVTLFISMELGLLAGLILTLRQYLDNPNWDKKTENATEGGAETDTARRNLPR